MNKKFLIVLIAIIVVLGVTIIGLFLIKDNVEKKVITTPKEEIGNLSIENNASKDNEEDLTEKDNQEDEYKRVSEELTNNQTSKWSDKINKTKSISGVGYKATIQNDGSVRVEFNSDIKNYYSQDLYVLIHNLESTKKAISLFAGNVSTGVDPLICILYEDGTAALCHITEALENNSLKIEITKQLNAGSKIVGFESGNYNDFDCTYAVTENGEKIVL